MKPKIVSCAIYSLVQTLILLGGKFEFAEQKYPCFCLSLARYRERWRPNLSWLVYLIEKLHPFKY